MRELFKWCIIFNVSIFLQSNPLTACVWCKFSTFSQLPESYKSVCQTSFSTSLFLSLRLSLGLWELWLAALFLMRSPPCWTSANKQQRHKCMFRASRYTSDKLACIVVKRERRECVSLCVCAYVFEWQNKREGKVFFVHIRASVVYLTWVTSAVTITEDKNELKSNYTG